MRKILSMAIILLFIGVALAPTINASDEELVEFDVEFCGLGRKHTIQLTQQEAEEVELLFDDIEQRLSEVETREEAEEIFKEAVVELDKYGLLGGLSVKQAQRLVTGEYQNPLVNKLLEKKYLRQEVTLDDVNIFCLIAGVTSNTYFLGPIGMFNIKFCEFLYDFAEWIIDMGHLKFGVLMHGLAIISVFTLLMIEIINTILPVQVWGTIGIGVERYFWYEYWNEPAHGWIYTFGPFGITKWEESFYGQISTEMIFNVFFGYNYYPGVVGFSGLRFYSDFFTYYYLGSALGVSIDSNPPDV